SGDADIAVRLPPGVPAIFGPHDPADLTVTVHAVAVPVTASLLCMQDAHAVANAFLGAYPPRDVTPLATGTVTRTLELSAGGAHCPVALVLQSGDDLPATAYWSRAVSAHGAAIEAGPLRCTSPAPTPRAGPVQ